MLAMEAELISRGITIENHSEKGFISLLKDVLKERNCL